MSVLQLIIGIPHKVFPDRLYEFELLRKAIPGTRSPTDRLSSDQRAEGACGAEALASVSHGYRSHLVCMKESINGLAEPIIRFRPSVFTVSL
jgi:hypothetical protein